MIILNEQFDASMLILRSRLCWNYKDIFYSKKNVQQLKPSRLFTLVDAEKLIDIDHNYGDKLLYDALYDSWWHQAEVQHSNFWMEVCQYLTADCVH